MADRLIVVCTVILAGLYLHATEQLPALAIGDPLGSKAFPRLLAAGLFVTAAMLFVEMLRGRKRGGAAPERQRAERGAYVVITLVVFWTALYFLTFESLGYIIATAIYLFVLMAYFNRGRLFVNAATSVLFCLGSYFLFTSLLDVSLTRGVVPF